MKITFIALVSMIICSNLFAQSSPWCESAEHLQEMLAKYPELADRFERSRQQMMQYRASGQKQGRALVTIPVVVHVVHDGDSVGGSENISAAQIMSQIDALNRDYRNQNPGLSGIPSVFRALAADFEIEFCLASRDPSGNPTSGIERIHGGRVTWDRTHAEQFKPSTIWNSDHYLNIWTMRLGGTNANTLGYSQFPGFPDSTDGVVIDYTAFGTTGSVISHYDQGKTTTHEIGHWLGIYHIWGDDTGSCAGDDFVFDTPVQASENFGCPAFPHVSCNNGPNGEMFMNYMDYTNDDCSGMFTAGQKDVADATFANYRQAILSSPGCTPTTVNQLDMAITQLIFPTAQICTDVFVPVIRVRNNGSATITSMLINYQVDGAGLNQPSWSGSIPSLAFEYISLPELSLPPGQHSISIFLSAPNGGFDENPNNETVSVNFNIAGSGAGSAIPAEEGFESGALPAGWQIENPNSDRSWSISNSAGSDGTAASALFDNFSGTASSNGRGKRDGLVTPEFDFRAGMTPYVSFNVAYARKSTASRDSLIVYYSLDCGSGWSRMWGKGGSVLMTAAEKLTEAFVPSANEWRREGFSAHYLINQSRVKFKIENYSDFGNNIYVDEFKVDFTPVGISHDDFRHAMEVNVVPNPAAGRFSLVIKSEKTDDFKVSLINASGQEILRYAVMRSNYCEKNIDISGLPDGLYLARVASADFIACKKIMLKR